MKISRAFKLTLPAALIASLCCLSPLAFVLAGASMTSLAVTLFTRTLAPFEWAFFTAGLAFLAASLVLYFRRNGICTLDQVAARRREVINTSLLAGVVALASFCLVYGAVAIAGQSLSLWR